MSFSEMCVAIPQTMLESLDNLKKMPRTAIYLVACLAPFGLLVFGPDCSSWSVVARGTSWRSTMNPNGRLGLAWVRNANLMISRCFGCTLSI